MLINGAGLQGEWLGGGSRDVTMCFYWGGGAQGKYIVQGMGNKKIASLQNFVLKMSHFIDVLMMFYI